MKRVYLVRHGESEANAARINGGPHHPLTEKGREQGQFIAERCAALPIQELFSSTMIRARETGEIVSQKIGLPLTTSELFVELRGPSKFEEQPAEAPEVAQGFLELNRSYAPGYRYEDEENFDDLLERTTNALEFLAAREAEHVAVVTHGLFLTVLMARAVFGSSVTGREFFYMMRSFRLRNTGLTILEHYPEAPEFSWRVLTWNDHAHLAE